jgi:FkbM family methyltransferase
MTPIGPTETRKPFRQKVEEAWLRLIRVYTYNTPVKKGTYRMFLMATKLCKFPHVSLPVPTIDGRTISVDLTTGMEDTVFFHGRYEPVLTQIASSLISPHEVCVDAGANFGWYTTLFAKLVGDSGSVHAFEPVPRMFKELEVNCGLLAEGAHVFISNTALGEKNGHVTLHLFEGESTGHASMSTQGRTNFDSYDCGIVTLDSYLIDNKIDNVDFVKVDIEGAELSFLKGSSRLFEQVTPPIFLMEMALDTTKHFGYLPNDLLVFLAKKADYLFYAVDETRGRVRRITAFEPQDKGANVFCLPRSAPEEKLKAISRYLDV